MDHVTVHLAPRRARPSPRPRDTHTALDWLRWLAVPAAIHREVKQSVASHAPSEATTPGSERTNKYYSAWEHRVSLFVVVLPRDSILRKAYFFRRRFSVASTMAEFEPHCAKPVKKGQKRKKRRKKKGGCRSVRVIEQRPVWRPQVRTGLQQVEDFRRQTKFRNSRDFIRRTRVVIDISGCLCLMGAV